MSHLRCSVCGYRQCWARRRGRICGANKTVTQKKSWLQRGYVSQFIVTNARVSSGLPVLNGLNPTD